MVEVVLRNLRKRYGAVEAVKGLDLTIKNGEFLVLVGPSGCGKTTALRMLAGLEEITSGEVLIDGQVVNDWTPSERDIAMVFQSYALYPHMTVYDNLAFCLEMRGFRKNEMRQRIDEVAGILGIRELLSRKPAELSGGQRQRVAVGRAIVRRPKLFLFDEPLSNLDAKLRGHMRVELKRLHYKLGATAVYVTHDQVEAMTLGDRVVVMRDGLIQQVGAPLEVYAKPANVFVAGFIGSPSMNLVTCQVHSIDGRLVVERAGMRVAVPSNSAPDVARYDGREIIVGIRPESIHDASDNAAPESCMSGRVDVLEPLGAEILVDVHVGDQSIVMRTSAQSRIAVGQEVRLRIDAAGLHFFDPASEARIPSNEAPPKLQSGLFRPRNAAAAR